MKINTLEDLQSLIDNEVEESTDLEYKSSFAIENKKWKEELAKDVSAMANANGGTVIYGIREKEVSKGHSVASELLPIPYTEMSKDRLSQLLSSNIQPVIDSVEITVISKDENSGFFVVQIPQSNTAHQNRLNHLYYKRRNAVVEEMEDYEIRDVMNRSKHPIIELEFELHKTVTTTIEKPLKIAVMYDHREDKYSTETKYVLKYRLVNKGRVYAKYINFFIHVPLILNPNKEKEPENVDRIKKCLVISGDNTIRDITAINGLSKEYGPARYDPILPGITGYWESFELNFNDVDEATTIPPIWYSVLADNAPERKAIVEWSDIKVIEKTKTITRDLNNTVFNQMLFNH